MTESLLGFFNSVVVTASVVKVRIKQSINRIINAFDAQADEYALRAKRIEIPASITACAFYRKMGYDLKNGIDTVDAEQLYRLEKFR